MPVKVIVKGQKEKEPKSGKIPAIVPPRLKKKQDNIIIRTVKVMLMDIRMRWDPELRVDPTLKEEWEDYSRFCELARGKP